MYVGITHLGIVTFQGNKRTHQFKWYELCIVVNIYRLSSVDMVSKNGCLCNIANMVTDAWYYGNIIFIISINVKKTAVYPSVNGIVY